MGERLEHAVYGANVLRWIHLRIHNLTQFVLEQPLLQLFQGETIALLGVVLRW